MIGRRWFTGGVIATPIALGTGAVSTVIPPNPISGVVGASGMPDLFAEAKEVTRMIEPPRLKDYYDARQIAGQAGRYRHMLFRAAQNQNAANPNIMSLRSVTTQHKLRMLVDAEAARVKEEETFTQKLMDAFGVREWIDKQTGRYPSVDASSNSGGY